MPTLAISFPMPTPPPTLTQKITPFLWFDKNAEEAVAFYTSIFKNSRVLTVARYGDGAPLPKGTVMTIAFELAGQQFTALNGGGGGPHFKFTEAVSFVVSCDTQAEIDEYWEKLTAQGGSPVQCGWLKDRFGLSWQVIPTGMEELFADPDPTRAERAMSLPVPEPLVQRDGRPLGGGQRGPQVRVGHHDCAVLRAGGALEEIDQPRREALVAVWLCDQEVRHLDHVGREGDAESEPAEAVRAERVRARVTLEQLAQADELRRAAELDKRQIADRRRVARRSLALRDSGLQLLSLRAGNPRP